MNKIIMALPKGRILNELIPLLQKADILPEEEFFKTGSRKLLFSTNQKNLSIDYLVNNAGIMALPEYRETKDGFEMVSLT